MANAFAPRRYKIKGTISSDTKLSDATLVKPNNTEVPGSRLDIRQATHVGIHIIITNAAGLTANLTALVGALLPDPARDTFVGATYDNGASDITISADGEYFLDITATAAAFIDPVLEVSAGSCNAEIFIVGKS